MLNRVLKYILPCFIAVIIVTGCVPLISESQSNQELGELFVHFVDVGQGDALYIHYKNFDMIIDGGDNEHSDKLVNYLKKQNFKDLDLLVATHPHADHIGGLDDVIRQFQVKSIVDSGEKPSSKTSAFTNYQKAVQAEKASYEVDQNKTIQVDEFLKVEVLEMGDEFDEMNDNSVIVKLTYKKDTALFTGDAENLVESKLLKKVKTVGLFKAAHHGSNTSNSEALLKQITPKWVVISCGLDNEYNHPHEEVVVRLKKYTDRIYKTADNGHIIMKTAGNGWSASGTSRKALVATSKGQIHGDRSDQLEETESSLMDSNSLKIKSLNVFDEIVILENIGKTTIDLSGYSLYSTVGSQKFILPKWILKPGETVSIYSGAGKGKLKWTDQNMWNNSGDTAEVYSPEGQLLDRIVFKK